MMGLSFNLVGGPFSFSQGDAVVLYLTAQDGNGNPVNITGATFATTLRGINGSAEEFVSFPNGQHEIVDAGNGIFTLTLAPSDTQTLGIGANKDIVTAITIGGIIDAYRGNNLLTVLDPNPMQ